MLWRDTRRYGIFTARTLDWQQENKRTPIATGLSASAGSLTKPSAQRTNPLTCDTTWILVATPLVVRVPGKLKVNQHLSQNGSLCQLFLR